MVRQGGWWGGSGVLLGVWEGLTLYSGVLALLGSQMVVVNSSSPTAACSGPRETRGIEESVTATDGNAGVWVLWVLTATLTPPQSSQFYGFWTKEHLQEQV